MSWRSGAWEAPWLSKDSRKIRNIFYIVMIALLGALFFLRDMVKFDKLYLFIGFFSLFAIGLVLSSILERRAKTATRLKRAAEYIEAHPELGEEKRGAIEQGKVVGGMTEEEREIATGMVHYPEVQS
ncbi:MAG: hypothetical protein A2Y33_15960 [Spirochaetes bacterium GWF1_51_8]|nr:MAG: hypothetical protein A2Y33_15960 [Spirochaetes bacterium GWF1_51_8]